MKRGPDDWNKLKWCDMLTTKNGLKLSACFLIFPAIVGFVYLLARFTR